MRFAVLLCLAANLVQLGFPAAISNRDDSSDLKKPPYNMTYYEDTDPAKKYCNYNVDDDDGRNPNSPYSNSTILVNDCIDLIRFLRGNNYRFDFSDDDGELYAYNPEFTAVGFGTCQISLFHYDPDWKNLSVGTLDILQVLTKSVLMSAQGSYMHPTYGLLLKCHGDGFNKDPYGNGLSFLIHDARVDHSHDPGVIATNGFPSTISDSFTTPTPTPTWPPEITSRRDDGRNTSVRYHDSINRFGHDSYCDTPSNLTRNPRFQFAVEDCATLINILAGDASAGYFSGWWDVKDWDFCKAENYSWILIAGWETCNFAVVMPDCPSTIATPISRLDVAKAISWLLPGDGKATGNISSATMQCKILDEPVNVLFQVFDPSNYAAPGAGSTRLHGLVGVDTNSSSTVATNISTRGST